MTPETKEAYFARIGMEVPEKADLATLRQIQERHIYLVPFENIDIMNGDPSLSLEFEDLFDKVVTRRRGGICYELNLLLADVLEDVGYDVTRLAARHPRHGDDFDHALLMVKISGSDDRWIVDVGFADNFRTVLKFDPTLWQGDGRDEYTFRESPELDGYWQLIRRRKGEEALMYTLSLQPRTREDYREQFEWYSTDENSRFKQGALISIERPEGRISLTMDRVLNTYNDERIRSDISSQEEFDAALREIFGIELDAEVTDGLYSEGFGFRRVFAALDGSQLQDSVIEKAVAVAIGSKAHLRFGHIVEESKSSGEASFPEHVQAVRAAMAEAVASKLAELGVADRIHGGEVVVVGSNSSIGMNIDTPAGQVPERLVDSLIQPFKPDLVVCGERNMSRFQRAIKGSTSKHLLRNLDCAVMVVRE